MKRSKRSPKGNRQMRRILNQAANAAVKQKRSIFEIGIRHSTKVEESECNEAANGLRLRYYAAALEKARVLGLGRCGAHERAA